MAANGGEVSRTARDEISELHETWATAARAGDVDRLVELLADDYVLWAPGAPDVVGREAVRRLMKAALAVYELDPAFESIECLVSDDLAVDCGWDVQRAVARETGERRESRQRVALLLRRNAGGRWQYRRGFALPDPPVRAPTVE